MWNRSESHVYRSGEKWMLLALGAFLGFGLTNFILGWLAEKNGGGIDATLWVVTQMALAMGAVGMVWMLFSWIRRTLSFRGRPGGRVWFFPAVAGWTLIAGMIALKSGLAADPLSKGPIVALTAANSLVVAWLAWRILGEHLNRSHGEGLAVVLAGVLVIAASFPSRATWRGIFFGVLSLIGFGLTNFLLKWASHRGVDVFRGTMMLWISAGTAGIFLTGVRFLHLMGKPSALWGGTKVWAWAAGVLLAAGMLLLKSALTFGPAGPVTAVAGANAVLVALLDFGLLGHRPPLLKVAGMLLVIGGIARLALGKRSGSPAERNK